MTDWGNYQAYQGPARHPGTAPSSSHIEDTRLLLLRSLIPDLFTAKHVLDIGCNFGAVSTQLALNFEASLVHGVDIDHSLVSKAQSHYAFRCSRVRLSSDGGQPDLDYYPLSAILNHGPRDAFLQTNLESLSDRHVDRQISEAHFFAEDWGMSDRTETRGPYQVILALSVLKWIHLEHGDEGLVKLLTKCSQCLDPGGYLVIELQPWSSYEKAIKMAKAPHYRKNFESLRLRPENFGQVLKQCGFGHIITSDALSRDICIFQKQGQPNNAPTA